MSQIRSPFYAYRYLVTPQDEQLTLLQQIEKPKEELIHNIISNLARESKTEWIKKSKRYLLYGVQSKGSLHILKFARETNEKIYVETEDDIEERGIKNAKYVMIIFDTEKQIILVERNVSIFSKVSSSVKVLEEILRDRIRQYDYVVNVYPLATSKKFWNYVESAQEIYELSLVMNAPNMPFFGNKDTREVLKVIKEATNNEEFDISFKNKEGKLKVIKETIGGWIDYVREVGGRYTLKFSSNGITETRSSTDDIARTRIPRKGNEDFTDEELYNIKTKIDAIHDLETRNEGEED